MKPCNLVMRPLNLAKVITMAIVAWLAQFHNFWSNLCKALALALALGAGIRPWSICHCCDSVVLDAFFDTAKLTKLAVALITKWDLERLSLAARLAARPMPSIILIVRDFPWGAPRRGGALLLLISISIFQLKLELSFRRWASGIAASSYAQSLAVTVSLANLAKTGSIANKFN